MRYQDGMTLRAIGWIMGLSFLLAGRDGAAEGWTVRAGFAARGGIDLDIDGTSHVQSMGLGVGSSAGGPAGGPGGLPADDITAFADRQFDDGFVFIDPSTIEFGGDTWYWGYQTEEQYDADAGTLTFHVTSDATVESEWTRTIAQVLRDEDLSLHDTLEGFGVALEVSRASQRSGGVSIEWAAGVVGLWDMQCRLTESTFEQHVMVERWNTTTEDGSTATYTYDTLGVVPGNAPYEGTYEGPGPLIPNRPTSLSSEPSVQTSSRRLSSISFTARNEITFDVDLDLYEFWIGSRVGISKGPVRLFVLPKASLNLVEGRVDRAEEWVALYGDGSRVALASWIDHAKDVQWLPGLGLGVGCEWDVAEAWLVALSGEYDWVPEEYEVDVGPNRISVDVSGYSVNGMVGRRF